MNEQGSAGDHDRARAGRRPRLEDVAKRVGLSTASVSLVLSNAPGPSATTRQRVLEAAAQLGYRPDRNASLLARRRRHLIGVMMDVRNMFHAELVQHLLRSAEAVRYDLVLSPLTPTRDEQRAVETLLDFRCEALILLGPDVPSAHIVALGRQVAVVVIGRRIGADDVDVVRAADDKGVGRAIDYLASLGHRRIAFIDGGRGTIASDRRRGYRVAMRRHQLTEQIRIIPGDHTEEAGTRAAQSMLATGDLPSAVMASNDRCALGVLDSLNRAGIHVPGSVSLVGYDDSALARLAHIDLTTVSQNAREQAEQAVAAVVERLDNGRATRREVVLNPRLVVRSTAGPPPSAVEGDVAAVRSG
jgi:DNA-binding LacI/PurR family transcriptional regulator